MKILLPENKVNHSTLLGRLRVAETMRRRAVTLSESQTIDRAIRTLVKFKTDACLITAESGLPGGVVTRTELMGAYYAGLPLATELADIMAAPVIGCRENDSLESAMRTMQDARIHRIYAVDEAGLAVGTLAYPDIVGILYRHCCRCEHGLRQRVQENGAARLRYTIREAMTPGVTAVAESAAINEVIEKLSAFRLGALLVTDEAGRPAGVISKADLALAYNRGVPLESQAALVMSSPAHLCRAEDLLEEGIRQMILHEVGRLFVQAAPEQDISGVLSLSDAARMRSGSCQACTTSRIKVKE